MKYLNKNVAITGATGFIGSHAVKFFVDNGANVYILARDILDNKIFSSDKVNFIFGDVINKEDVDYLVEKSQPEIFIHLAAQTQAAYSEKYPFHTILNNVNGTLNVLESLRIYQDCKKIIVASSDKAYGELLGEEYTEDHVLNGYYPYDASKSMTDILCKTYIKSYQLPVISIRHCNVYGPGDLNYKRLVPGLMNHIFSNKEFIVRNGGTDIREYIYIDDVISSYDYILNYFDKENIVNAFNIGSGERFSSLDVVNIFNKKYNNNIKYSISNSNDTLEIKKQVMSYELLNKETGWSPRYKMENVADDIIKWYKERLLNDN